MDELMDLIDDTGMLYALALAQEMLSEEAMGQSKRDKALFEEKEKGIKLVGSCVIRYEKEMFDKKLIVKIARTKYKNILAAKTMAEAREAAALPKPQYSYGEWLISPKSVPEEELIMWAMVSPNHMLANHAVKRYMDLFQQVYGMSPQDVMALNKVEQEKREKKSE